ncbi:hypothetical protein LCGC14_2171680 [marine sediment metagenome]|uniref:Uncharacterized protein n=1 Tax=marine sediment metagenome TaxID=412755 RepID=A0A0F9DQ20_9ZZZZ
MEQREIPLPYKIILKRFWQDSEFGKIGVHVARLILSHIFRMGKENVFFMIREMKEAGFIECASKRFYIIKIDLKDLV